MRNPDWVRDEIILAMDLYVPHRSEATSAWPRRRGKAQPVA